MKRKFVIAWLCLLALLSAGWVLLRGAKQQSQKTEIQTRETPLTSQGATRRRNDEQIRNSPAS